MSTEPTTSPEFSAKAPIPMADSLKKSSVKKPPSSYQPFWIFVSFILAALALALSGLCYYQQYRGFNLTAAMPIPPGAIDQIQQLLTADQTTLQQHQAQLADLNKQLDAFKKSSSPARLKWIAQQRSALQTQINDLQLLSTTMHLQLAKSLLLSHQDKALVSDELQQANVILQTATDMTDSLQSLQAMSKQVNNLPELQTNATLTGLQQLQNQLSTLKFKPPITPLPAPMPTNPQLSVWQQSLAKLRSLVVIHHNNEVSKELITTSDRLNALRTIQVSISTAMLNAIQGNPVQYQHSMAQLISTITLYTQADTAQSLWLTQATQLSQQTVGYSTQQMQPILTGLDTLMDHLQTLAK